MFIELLSPIGQNTNMLIFNELYKILDRLLFIYSDSKIYSIEVDLDLLTSNESVSLVSDFAFYPIRDNIFNNGKLNRDLLDSIENDLNATFEHYETNEYQEIGYGELLSLLTPREREVLTLISKSYSSGEICIRMNMAQRTFHNHKTNIIKKLKSIESGISQNKFEILFRV